MSIDCYFCRRCKFFGSKAHAIFFQLLEQQLNIYKDKILNPVPNPKFTFICLSLSKLRAHAKAFNWDKNFQFGLTLSSPRTIVLPPPYLQFAKLLDASRHFFAWHLFESKLALSRYAMIFFSIRDIKLIYFYFWIFWIGAQTHPIGFFGHFVEDMQNDKYFCILQRDEREIVAFREISLV